MRRVKRREFLKTAVAASASALALRAGFDLSSTCALAQQGASAAAAGKTLVDDYFLQILRGFLVNAGKTSGGFAVCDFPSGTKLKSCLTPGGKTYVSTARMIPAMAEWVVGGREPKSFDVDGQKLDLTEVLLSIYRDAFDPKHPDFWGEAPSDKATQRSVEAALVGYGLARLGPKFVEKLTSEQRTNVQKWLASCTQVPERKTNHAWFTAINQGSRIELSHTFSEFKGDEPWMIEDLKALDALYKEENDGWYSDSPDQPIFDYYNFWTFANFPLYWSQTIGRRYPEWNEKFRSRVKTFLQTAPHFFAPDGSHPLFGRSLIYRWGMLSPLVAGYQQGLWPHSPGLLKKIVRTHMQWHWNMGCFDEANGKLRETFSKDGTEDIREPYIDNGHPYWAMQAFTMLSIPASDPLWTSDEEPLPVEKGDYTLRFKGPEMMVVGVQRSGIVKWVQAENLPKRDYYRDRYVKFVHSSNFPYNIIQNKDRVPWDQALVFRNPATGAAATRSAIVKGGLTDKGVETIWTAELEGLKFQVTSRIDIDGEIESHAHDIVAPPEAIAKGIEVIEGSCALGLADDEQYETIKDETSIALWCKRTDHAIVASWVSGFTGAEICETFEESGRKKVNLIHPRVAVLTLRAPLKAEQTHLQSQFSATPKYIKNLQLRKGVQG